MGGCHSSAALDPVEATGGAAPVFWSPEREQEKRLAKLKELRAKQEEEIERATGHLRRPSGTDLRSGRRSSSALSPHSKASQPQPQPQPLATEAVEVKKVEEEKSADDVHISSPRPVPAISIPSHTQLPSSAPLSPVSSAPSSASSSALRHHRSASQQQSSGSGPLSSTPATPSSTRRTSAPGTPGRTVRKGEWDYAGLPGARPTAARSESAEGAMNAEPMTAAVRGSSSSSGSSASSGVQRHVRAPTMDSVSEPAAEEKEQPEEGQQQQQVVYGGVAAVSKVSSGDAASGVFGVKLRRVQREVDAPPASSSAAAAVAS